MLKRLLVSASSFFVVLICTTATAQNLCPAGVKSDKLICLIPQVYGPNGLVLLNTNSAGLGVAPFQNALPQALSPLNSSIARQAALLPLASPSSGITFSWNEASKIFVESTDSFGPIFGERADTIGKYRVYIGFGYQHFKFENHDGVGLHNVREVFTQPDTVITTTTGSTTCSLNGPDSVSNLGPCGFIRDIITSNNRIDLTLHEFTTFATFGLTQRIDVSMAIPIENVRMGITSDATIKNISATGVHQFPDRLDCSPCLHSSSSNVGTASGIGDITFRVKGMAWKGEKAGLALGVDIRVPTGDPLNYTGAGASGVRPFFVWSLHSRFSPHAFIGYESNGSSVIADDITTAKKERLPGQLTYSGGVDVWLNKRVTVAFDLVGQEVFQAQRLSSTQFVEPLACQSPSCILLALPPAATDPNVAAITGTYNISNASIGAKLRPFSTFLITGNIMLKLNEGGLRAKIAPFIAASYTF